MPASMPAARPRLFVSDALTPGALVALPAEQAHYLGTVLRTGVGDTVRLFNGSDGEFLARIAARGRATMVLHVEQVLRPQRDGPDLWLVFALLKRQATDLVVQKATELGVAALLPVLTARTNAGRVNEQRLAAIAMEAAEQSERLTVPAIRPVQELAALLAGWDPGRRLAVAVERAELPGIEPIAGPAALLVGPEGGFTAPELDAMGSRPFVQPVSLGPLVLRAETAAIAGLALLQAPRGADRLYRAPEFVGEDVQSRRE